MYTPVHSLIYPKTSGLPDYWVTMLCTSVSRGSIGRHKEQQVAMQLLYLHFNFPQLLELAVELQQNAHPPHSHLLNRCEGYIEVNYFSLSKCLNGFLSCLSKGLKSVA
jgi:hypothetical protein